LLKVEWTESAIKDLNRLDNLVAKRILKKITWFSQNFEHSIPEPLSGDFKETYKLRVGDWRVIYTIKEGSIIILFVGHRREVYKLNR